MCMTQHVGGTVCLPYMPRRALLLECGWFGVYPHLVAAGCWRVLSLSNDTMLAPSTHEKEACHLVAAATSVK